MGQKLLNICQRMRNTPNSPQESCLIRGCLWGSLKAEAQVSRWLSASFAPATCAWFSIRLGKPREVTQSLGKWQEGGGRLRVNPKGKGLDREHEACGNDTIVDSGCPSQSPGQLLNLSNPCDPCPAKPGLVWMGPRCRYVSVPRCFPCA